MILESAYFYATVLGSGLSQLGAKCLAFQCQVRFHRGRGDTE